MLPWLILGGVAVAFLIVGGGAMSRNRRAEHPATETAADREELEHEFDEAERYQEQWRKDNPDEERIP